MPLKNIYFLFRKFNFLRIFVGLGELWMLTSALRSKGILVGETKVGNILKEINPNAQKARQHSAGRSLNPKVYKADYFGPKIHYGQNEKLGMYGIVYVCARDGYSGKIIGHAKMAKKNNIIIYNEIYR